MSGFSRRSFLQMLGLGGIGAVVTTKAAALPPLPLFGSDEIEAMVSSPSAHLLKGHVIVQKKGITERVPPEDVAAYMAKARNKYGGVPVARLTRSQVPGGGGFSSLTPHQLFIKGEFGPGVDPHVAYYKASKQMREQFTKLSYDRLLSVAPELRHGATLVTVVEGPITAVARYAWERDAPAWDRGQPQTGFDVVATFRQGIRYDVSGLNTFNVYSETGEYPVHVPSNIDIALLMKMDKQVLSNTSLLTVDPRRWRPGARANRILLG